jgi:arylsulfatase A-like enzyme
MGVAGCAIAASTYTASGYPSILTGKYPSEHQVWDFSDSVKNPPQLLTQTSNIGIDASNICKNVDEPAKVSLQVCGEKISTTLAELESPFVNIVHDPGGHMTYGRDETADQYSPSAFFNHFEDQLEEMVRLYQESVEGSADRFKNMVVEIKSRNEIDDTLTIFTSDHGELLGEYGGVYEHTTPMVPELVRIPLFFMGAGLPEGEQFDRLLSTTDIAPTALSALDNTFLDTAGYDL